MGNDPLLDIKHYLMLLVARFFLAYEATKIEHWVYENQFYAERPVPKGRKVKITIEYEDD